MIAELPVNLEAFGDSCDCVAEWPLPGDGRTARRLGLLTDCAREDLVLGRLIEAHADALAITGELGAADLIHPGQRWGVWAAGAGNDLHATRRDAGWCIEGEKRWCSGATLVSNALVDADTDDGQQLFAVRLSEPGVAVGTSDWVGPGMARSDTRPVAFDGVPAVPVGRPGEYLTRPGFWAGAIGVAACWHGGTVRIAEALFQAARSSADAHLLSHLGATHAALFENQSVLTTAAAELDSPGDQPLSVLARSVRTTVERNAAEVMDRVGRALGPSPLAYDQRHAETVADLTVYIRQHHAERDLERLGREIAERDPPWDGLPRTGE